MKAGFRIAPHSVTPGEQMVEVWLDGRFVGAIYGTTKGIKIVSKHLTGKNVLFDASELALPALKVRFKD